MLHIEPMTVRNENLYLDMAIGVAVVATVVFVFAMVLMPTFYALLTALVLSFLFNWLHFRWHLSRITISNKGEVELWDIRGRLHRITHLSHIEHVRFLEGGMSVGSPRLKMRLLHASTEMVHYLASRRRNELLAFLDRMETAGVQVSKG